MEKLLKAQCKFEELDLSNGLPSSIPLFNIGDVEGRDGRSWKASNALSALQYFKKDKKHIPIDFEHATEIKAPKGEPAPAVGWITNLEEKDGCVWGTVEWNPIGEKALQNKEYKYYSPTLLYDRKTNEIKGISSVGLTNSPNLLVPALCQQEKPQEDTMAEETAQEEQQMTKEEMRTALCEYLGVPVETTDEELIEIIKRLYEEANKSEEIVEEAVADIVEGEATNSVLKRLDRMEKVLNSFVRGVNEDKIQNLIFTAIKEGKIAPCNKEHYIALCRKNGIEEVTKIINNTKSSLFDTVNYTSNIASKPTLTADEKAMCRATGTSEEAFLKVKNMEGK